MSVDMSSGSTMMGNGGLGLTTWVAREYKWNLKNLILIRQRRERSVLAEGREESLGIPNASRIPLAVMCQKRVLRPRAIENGGRKVTNERLLEHFRARAEDVSATCSLLLAP